MRRTSPTSRSTVSHSRRQSSSSTLGADYLEIFDADHPEAEDRFIALGPVKRGIVVVVYAEPEENLIRIIGARTANKRERDLFRSYMDQRT